jgi:gas vesicle protein
MGQTAEELRADIEHRRENMSGTVDAIQDRVMPGRIVDRRKQAARQWWHDTKSRVMGTGDGGPSRVEQASERMQEATSGIRDAAGAVTDAPAQVARQTRGAPLVAGGIAMGVGALIAFALPETDSERRAAETLAPQLDAARDAAKEAGGRVLDSTKEAAQEAASTLKDDVTTHAQQVTDEVGQAAQHVAQDAKEQAGSARDQIRQS